MHQVFPSWYRSSSFKKRADVSWKEWSHSWKSQLWDCYQNGRMGNNPPPRSTGNNMDQEDVFFAYVFEILPSLLLLPQFGIPCSCCLAVKNAVETLPQIFQHLSLNLRHPVEKHLEHCRNESNGIGPFQHMEFNEQNSGWCLVHHLMPGKQIRLG